MEYIQFSFEGITEEKTEILIAMLSQIDFDGFEEEKTTLKAIIKKENFNEILFNNVIETTNVNYYKSIIKEENWNEKWESDYEPVKVYHPITSEPFAFIRANFHQPEHSFLHNIMITPKMSFGTGHHATTQLMVTFMSEIDFTGKSVIDFGTGTGVLAIASEILGATRILGIDNDIWSINNAQENLIENKCTKTTLILADTIERDKKADIILANINLNVIKLHIEAIVHAAESNSTFLFSGIMKHDEENIKRILENASLHIVKIERKAEWLLVKATNF